MTSDYRSSTHSVTVTVPRIPPQHRTIPTKRTPPCTTLHPATRNGALPPNALNSPDASNSGNIPVWILHLLIYPHIYRLLIRYCTWVVVLGSTPNAVLSVPRTCTGIGGLGYTESSVALKLGYKPGTPPLTVGEGLSVGWRWTAPRSTTTSLQGTHSW